MKLLFVLYFLLPVLSLKAQNYLTIGDRIPAFTAKIAHYKKPILNAPDLKGRLTILDFWNVNCKACIAAMPKMQELKERFGNAIEIILVTSDDEQKVAALAAKNKIVKEHQLPSVVGDTFFYRRFNFQSVPTHIWIDSTGKIVYITEGWDTNENSVSAYLKGAHPKLAQKIEDRNFDYKGFLNVMNKDNPFFSHLQQYSFFMSGVDNVREHYSFEKDSKTGRLLWVSFFNEFPANMFVYAFTDKLQQLAYDSRRLLLNGDKAKNLTVPEDSSLRSAWREANRFCYQIRVPEALSNRTFEFMRQDLNRFFGVKAEIKKEKQKCLVLVKGPAVNSLPSGEGGPLCELRGELLVMNNIPMKSLVYCLNIYSRSPLNIAPFYDETGITGNIHLELNVGSLLKGDVKGLATELRKHGFDLTEKEEYIDMIVITDEE